MTSATLDKSALRQPTELHEVWTCFFVYLALSKLTYRSDGPLLLDRKSHRHFVSRESIRLTLSEQKAETSRSKICGQIQFEIRSSDHPAFTRPIASLSWIRKLLKRSHPSSSRHSLLLVNFGHSGAHLSDLNIKALFQHILVNSLGRIEGADSIALPRNMSGLDLTDARAYKRKSAVSFARLVLHPEIDAAHEDVQQ